MITMYSLRIQRFRKFRSSTAAVLLVIILLISLYRRPTQPIRPAVRIWKTLAVLYDSHAPVSSSLIVLSDAPRVRIDDFQLDPDHERIHGDLIMRDEDIITTRQIHRSLLENIPPYPRIFRGEGIVVLGGGEFFTKVALVSLRLLRRTGSKLPVEIWFENDEEFDKALCGAGREFSQMNIECRVVSHVIAEIPTKFSIKGYQLKALVLLFSKFERVLLLDADNIPLYDPYVLFNSSPFVEKKVVAWPDFWRATVSDYYFQIADISQYTSHSKRTIPMNGTVESGQLLWDKRHRWKSLVLALYYNMYGPEFFYKLFSVGAPGQGDKETWTMACRATGEDFYLVTRGVRAIGRHYGSVFRGAAMGQSDPRDDVRAQRDNEKEVGLFFFHAHSPKLSGVHIIQGDELPIDPETRKRVRMWGDDWAEHFGSRDLEREAWTEMLQIECELHFGNFTACKAVQEHFSRVFNEI